MLSHKYLSKILEHENIAFINDDGSVKHDPLSFFENISENEKIEIMKIIQGDNFQMHINNKYTVKKTGSGVVLRNQVNATTYIVYSDTFIPFDSSF